MSADWFCKIADKKVGPLNAQQLKTFAAKGQLKPEHLVRRGSEGPWVPAGRIKGLFTIAVSGDAPPGKMPAAKPLPTAVKSSTPQASPLPTASEPPPPPTDVPEELSLGGQHKHHVEMNVDKFDIETTPVMVSRKKMKSGLQSMKEADQKKFNVILLSVIGGGTAFGLIVFIWAFASGLLSAPATKTETPQSPTASVAAAPPPADSSKPKPEEKNPAPKAAQVVWPTKFKTPMTETTNVGDFQVVALKAERGDPPAGLKTTDTEVLIVPVNVQLRESAKGGKKNIEFTGWDDPQIKKDVLLNDDKEGKGNKFDFLGQVYREGDDAKAIAKGRIQVRLVFELPAKLSKPLYLALPTSAFHVEGPMIAYELKGVKEPQKSP